MCGLDANEVISTRKTCFSALFLFLNIKSHQALLESMGSIGSTGPEALAAAEKNAALLTARAGARDPSAIPSICRVSAALQYPAGKFLFIHMAGGMATFLYRSLAGC